MPVSVGRRFGICLSPSIVFNGEFSKLFSKTHRVLWLLAWSTFSGVLLFWHMLATLLSLWAWWLSFIDVSLRYFSGVCVDLVSPIMYFHALMRCCMLGFFYKRWLENWPENTSYMQQMRIPSNHLGFIRIVCVGARCTLSHNCNSWLPDVLALCTSSCNENTSVIFHSSVTHWIHVISTSCQVQLSSGRHFEVLRYISAEDILLGQPFCSYLPSWRNKTMICNCSSAVLVWSIVFKFFVP